MSVDKPAGSPFMIAQGGGGEMARAPILREETKTEKK